MWCLKYINKLGIEKECWSASAYEIELFMDNLEAWGQSEIISLEWVD